MILSFDEAKKKVLEKKEQAKERPYGPSCFCLADVHRVLNENNPYMMCDCGHTMFFAGIEGLVCQICGGIFDWDDLFDDVLEMERRIIEDS